MNFRELNCKDIDFESWICNNNNNNKILKVELITIIILRFLKIELIIIIIIIRF